MEDAIVIDEEGNVSFVYSDELAALFEGETQRTRRASHVEPHPTKPGWLADMRPVNGPTLGANRAFADNSCVHGPGAWCRCMADMLEPFTTRAAALAAERAWLRVHLGL